MKRPPLQQGSPMPSLEEQLAQTCDLQCQVPAELMALDNVVLLPHIASGTRETRQAMADRVFDNLQACFDNRAMPSPAPRP